MLDPLVGTIIPWSASFVPDGWMKCDGRILQIQEYATLFSLIGTTYGGDGRVTFALPDFTGCVPIGEGSTPIGELRLGMMIGEGRQSVQIQERTMPSHTHSLDDIIVNVDEMPVTVTFQASQEEGERSAPQGNDYIGAIPKISGRQLSLYRNTMGAKVNLSGISGNISETIAMISGETKTVGSGVPIQVSNTQPVLGLDFIIAYEGEYPDRQ